MTKRTLIPRRRKPQGPFDWFDSVIAIEIRRLMNLGYTEHAAQYELASRVLANRLIVPMPDGSAIVEKAN